MSDNPALDLILFGRRESAAARAARYGLVAAWSLADLTDSFGANTLTNTNTVTFVAGKVGNGAHFTAASSQRLSITDNAALSTGAVDFWGAAWVNLDSLGPNNRVIMAKLTGSNGAGEFDLRYDTALAQYRFRTWLTSAVKGDVAATTFGSPSTGAYHFVMFYHSTVSSVVRISVDGGAFDSAATTGNPADTANALAIGSYSDGINGMDGIIDAAYFGKSPPGGIIAVATEIRDYLWAGGAGREYPLQWT